MTLDLSVLRYAVPMDDRTLRFLIFAAFGVASLWAGYFARRHDWVKEEVSRRVHWHTVVWVWALVSLISLWRAPLGREDIWLILISMVTVATASFGVIPIAKALGCSREQVGVIAVASGVGNLGFTLGGYICYSILDPGEKALGIAIAFVSVMQVMGIVLLYPVARHFSPREQSDMSLPRLIITSILDIRSMPLYAAVAGQLLGLFGPTMPKQVNDWHIIDVLFYLGSFGGYFGIGLRLRLGGSLLGFVKPHAILAGMKFVFMPLLSWVLLYLIARTGRPVSPTAHDVVMIEAFMPTAIQTVMIANLFHLDTRLASAVWLWNTLFFLIGPMGLILWWWR